MTAPKIGDVVRIGDLAAFFDAKAEWSRVTFGPGDRYAGVCAHIRKELAEIESKPADLVEWIDVVLLAMDGAWRSAGADGAAFVAALVAKDARNRGRTWPDWRTLAPGAVSEHVAESPIAEASPVEESAAVAHWHRKATEALAECERLRDGQARTVRELEAMRADACGAQNDLARVTAERDEAIREATKAVAENARLTAECTRLRTVATGYATTRRDRDAVATICEALGMGEADDRTPAGAVRAIVTMRTDLAELIADSSVLLHIGDMLRARDAQDGDRIAAWVERTRMLACVRCWHPSGVVPSTLALDADEQRAAALCDACKGDDARASAEEGDDGKP